MDNQINQGVSGTPVTPPNIGSVPPPPPPVGGPAGGQDPHAEILSALKRIEDKLTAISTKIGA